VKVLFVSNLFPNAHEPARGTFNFQQIRHLAQHCDVQIVAPIAWFFIRGRFAPPAPVPFAEEIGGLRVLHPKNFYLPKLGRTLNPMFFALSLRKIVEKIRAEFPFDVIFVNWAYPDACGVANISRALGVPFVASISGSDVNWYLQMRIRRRQILKMLDAARAVTVRSRALRELLIAHGVSADKIHVLYNGVDRTLFHPSDAPRPTPHPQLLYVGRLSDEKGVADLLHALKILHEKHKIHAHLRVVGDGLQRDELQKLAESLQLTDKITWLGAKNPREIPAFMTAADALCLPSHMEGVPNAALEAFACGLPVVATKVGGIPEIMTEQTGILAAPQNPASFADALADALGKNWDATAIRAHAARFDWNENARRLFEILCKAGAPVV
jgi:glycosyltransferase involved in cell wall biosynthesis